MLLGPCFGRVSSTTAEHELKHRCLWATRFTSQRPPQLVSCSRNSRGTPLGDPLKPLALIDRSPRSKERESKSSVRFTLPELRSVWIWRNGQSSQDLVSHATVRIRADMLFGIKVIGKSGIDLARLVECFYLFR
jgi:hypothetical protein